MNQTLKQRNTDKIILASQSPRRKELLGQAGLSFDILAADIDEEALVYSGDPADYANTLSRMKAEHIARSHPTAWTIGADTIVVADARVLNKPRNRDDAVEMLSMLSGRSHSVFTGYTIACPDKNVLISDAVETQVVFKTLTPNEIQWYADTEEPYDKAGAYGIQGIGSFMVKQIAGSYSNVVGLPVCEVIDTLTRIGVIEF
ncbi:MAG TPA: septum formation protein Maf [Desulfobacteraceae bacterium]|nr:septum formation protein Maf [Desulfobacteraceae bacterium]